MKQRFILFRRAGVFYYEDTTTGKQLSLRTKDEAEAITLLNAKNESFRQYGSALGERPCTAVSGKRTMNTVLPLVWTYNRDCRYPTFDEMVLNIMPLLKNGDTPEHQTILNVLETIAERYLHDRWRLRKSCQNLLNL